MVRDFLIAKRKVLETVMEKKWGSLNFYTNQLPEEAGSLKICFKTVAPLYARGNLRGNQEL